MTDTLIFISLGIGIVIIILQIISIIKQKGTNQDLALTELREELSKTPLIMSEKQAQLAESMAQRVNEMNQWTLKALAEVRESSRLNQESSSKEISELKEKTAQQLEKVSTTLEETKQGLQDKVHERLSQQQLSMEERIKGLTDSIESRIHRLNTSVEEKLQESTKALREGLVAQQEASTKQLELILSQMNEGNMKAQAEFGSKLEGTSVVVGKVNMSLGQLAEQARAMQELGKDIHSLQEVLMAPKLRGGLGETLLEEMLASQLPKEMYEFQYNLDEGARVDAVVKLNGKMVIIDSKFPLESFRRMRGLESDAERLIARKEFEVSVKARCDEIARKYIRPEKGTFHFALMYLPSEAVFYEVVGNSEKSAEDLNAYCLNKRVVPVSPNSFMAYLQCIILGLRGFEIQKNAEAMLGQIQQLQIQFERFFTDFTVMGKHFRNLMVKYEDSQKKAERFGQKMSSLTKREFNATQLEDLPPLALPPEIPLPDVKEIE